MSLKHQIVFISICLLLSNNIFSQSFERSESAAGLASLRENNGVAVADFDGDNDLDIFIVAKNKDITGIDKTHSKLFRNDNNGVFTDITEEAGLLNLLTINEPGEINPALEGFKYGISWGDYDNDGFPDLFFTHIYKVQLFRNQGDGTFIEKTIEAGFEKTNTCWNTGATWFDFNNDSYLDIYISDWGNCDYNSFYINNGDGTFKNVTEEFGSSTKNIKSYLSIPFDMNKDGFMDLYVTNDHEFQNELFINNNGNSFTEDAQNYGLNSKEHDMGLSVGDYNNDGAFDFFITTINNNVFYKNNGNNTFSNISEQNKTNKTGWAWDTVFADFDLDGDEDLFIVNGFNLTKEQFNIYFENKLETGIEEFIDNSESVNLNDFTQSVGATSFDYDNDGDLDLFISNTKRESFFYQNLTNNGSNNRNWFKISLEGTTSNKNAIGTELSITTNQGTIHRYYTGIGFLSQSIQPVHFGLNTATEINELNIKWPSGLEETYQNLNANSFIKAVEGNGYEVLNINPSEKIKGCTDPDSCNYNPLATQSDGSCTYLPPKEIIGNTQSSFNHTETYNYTTNNSIVWTVEGGEIISGQGTSTLVVQWGFNEIGKLAVQESNSECRSHTTELNVTIDVINSSTNYSIARIWNEALLEAIRNDFARPNVHARNLLHTSIALYDAWAIYDEKAGPYLIGNRFDNFNNVFTDFIPSEKNIEEETKKAISYAAYRLLTYRFKNSPGATESLERFDLIMNELGYDLSYSSSNYKSGNAADLGNHIANTIIEFGKIDGSNEATDYGNSFYTPINPPLNLFGTNEATGIIDPNRWQPLTFNTFIDQSGNIIEGSTPEFLGPEWGNVTPFALNNDMKSTFERDGNLYSVYLDPGQPPQLNTTTKTEESDQYKWNFALVSIWSSFLDPSDKVMWDISPNTIGNIDIKDFPKTFEDLPTFYNETEGGDISNGHSTNPSTGKPYKTQMVPRADYARVLAEFWADGPDSETPPGHWFTILNYVNDHPQFQRKFNGKGDELTSLEWDVKAYFILSGAMHDAAISAWGIKGWYDYIRPISAIRYMAELGQSSNKNLDNYHVGGIPLKDGFIEVVQVGDPLSGNNNENIDKIKVLAWKGHDFISDAKTDVAGVDWILAENWWPYQRPSFVTPPFAGYVSGHSTYSRAAAEVMTLITGDEFFPGGLGEFIAKKDEFLVFEKGPSVDVILQWATYRDASDQTSLSRIWGGIHPPADDIPGRIIGEKIGINAFNFAIPYFSSENVDIDDISKEIVIYPNPVISKTVYIKNTTNTDNFSLYDQLGKLIPLKNVDFDSSTSISTIKFMESTIPGLYFLKINNNSKLLFINN